MRILILVLIVMVISCSPPVVFEQAYPSDQEDLKEIPSSFQGAFICESDSALVLISDNSIVLHKTHYFDTNVRHVEEREDCKIVDDKMYVTGRLECIAVTLVNDTLVRGIVKETDTLFVMQEESVARMYNGHLVINQQIKEKEWSVSLLAPEFGGNISFKAITNTTNIKNVKKVTHTTDITSGRDKSSRYRVRPTMKEFDELLADDKVFIECEYLKRVQLDPIFLN